MSTIAPDATGIYYDPETWQVTSAAATTIQGGAELRVEVTGSPADLAATFDLTGVATPLPHVAIRIDNEPAVRSEVAANIPIPIPTSNQWTKHTITITVAACAADVNRWSRASAVRFTGITSTSSIAAGIVRAPALVGMMIGDSLGEGFWSLGTSAVHGTAPTRTDTRYGWAYPLARLLGARPIQVTYAGVGLTKGGNGSVPKFASNWNLMSSGIARTFATMPDFVVMMPGTNDNAATDATVTSETTAWLNDMLSTLTNGCPIIVARPWYGTKAAAIQAGIAACTTPSRVHWIDTTGWVVAGDSSDNLHPYGYQNVDSLAPRLADAVRPIIEGTAPAPVDSVAWIKTTTGKKALTGVIRG